MKVTKEAKRLLKESIIKWEGAHTKLVLAYGEEYCFNEYDCYVIVNGDIVLRHKDVDCPLCNGFECKWCPIGCDGNKCSYNGSTYNGWRNYFEENEDSLIGKEHIQSHLAMITYMKNLYKKCVICE